MPVFIVMRFARGAEHVSVVDVFAYFGDALRCIESNSRDGYTGSDFYVVERALNA